MNVDMNGMRPSQDLRIKIILLFIFAVTVAISLPAQEKQVGEIADEFELFNVRTGEPVRLTDFEGSVVVLDFFFYW